MWFYNGRIARARYIVLWIVVFCAMVVVKILRQGTGQSFGNIAEINAKTLEYNTK
jgi:uncharacterized membrane protein YhaH (DUF805 family)